jgi:CheY-like chemotaxis protein
MAEDDEDDRILIQAALKESGTLHPVDFVTNGEELLAYLRRSGHYAYLKDTPLPGLVLLDLNMPRKNGQEVLQEIREDDHLCHIPVVIFTTSQQEDDIRRSYRLGANSFITKPVTFERLVTIINSLSVYWFQTVQLPSERQTSRQ